MMTDDEIFEAALSRAPEERIAFLVQACAHDTAQLERLRELIGAHDDAEDFLQHPAVQRDTVPLPLSEQVGDQINAYKLVQQIGEGGVGVVWMARQERPLRRMVALKIIKLGMDTQAVVARFEAERQALALMEHPNIAKVLDAGVTATGRPYFVMELVRGVPITQFCDQRQLNTPERLALFIAVCHAVHHAHQKGVIHRDLKPSNILVTENGDTAVPKVIDFGIAKATQGRLSGSTVFTAFEQFIGTPVYMSPEQADMSSLDIDTRSDIYSLGVLLFELLTGRTPFDAKTILEGGYREVGRRIREVEPERPSERLATLAGDARTTMAKSRRTTPAQLKFELQGDLDWIILRCLEKDRSRRYESAAALALDLQRHLRDEPVAARPPSSLYLAQKMFRRNRAAMTVALVTLLVLVFGGGFSAWQAVRATHAEREQARLRVAEKALLQQVVEKEHVAHLRAYAADMNLAQQAWANDNLGLARLLLDRHRPAAGEPDFRGWEWRYLWQLTRSEAAGVLARKSQSVAALALSNDQNWLAMAQDESGELSVINLRTRQEHPVKAGAWPVRVLFSPTEPILAISSSHGRGAAATTRVQVWSANTRQVLAEWTGGSLVGFSADGRTLVTTSPSRGGSLARWNMPSGEAAGEIPIAAEGFSAISSDLALVARVDPNSTRGRVQILESSDGRERWSFDLSDESVTALALSRDGRLLAAAASNTVPTIQVWDTATGKRVATSQGHRTYITALCFWPDGKTIASAGTDQTIRLWDIEQGEARRVLRGHQLEVRSLALLGDTTLVSGAKDGTVFLWDLGVPEARRRYRIDGVTHWGFAPGEDGVATLDAAGVLTLRRGREFEEAKEHLSFTRPEEGPGTLMESPLSGAPPPANDVTPGGREGARVIFSADAPLVALRGNDGGVKVFDWEAGRLQRELATGTNPLAIVGFTHGGAQLILAHPTSDPDRRQLRAWDTLTAAQRQSWPVALAGSARYSLAPDARKIAIRTAEGEVSVLDLATGEERTLPVVGPMSGGPGFSSDGRWLALPSTAGWVKMWSLERNEVVAELTGFVLGVHSAAFSPDNRRLIAGSGGAEAVRIWNTDEFDPLLSLAAEGSRFSSVAFSHDGNVIGARNVLGQLHLWRAPSFAEIEAEEYSAPSLSK